MKKRLLALALATAACAFGYRYSYDYTPPWDNFWYHNGDPGTWAPSVTSFSGYGSMIYNQSPYYPYTGSNPNDYEIKTQLAIKAGGGTFIHYLRASSDALASATSCGGSYYSVEIYAPYGSGY